MKSLKKHILKELKKLQKNDKKKKILIKQKKLKICKFIKNLIKEELKNNINIHRYDKSFEVGTIVSISLYSTKLDPDYKTNYKFWTKYISYYMFKTIKDLKGCNTYYSGNCVRIILSTKYTTEFLKKNN